MEERHDTVRQEPDPEQHAADVGPAGFRTVGQQEEDACYDGKDREDHRAFGETDAAEPHQTGQDQPDTQQYVCPDLHEVILS